MNIGLIAIASAGAAVVLIPPLRKRATAAATAGGQLCVDLARDGARGTGRIATALVGEQGKEGAVEPRAKKQRTSA